MKIRPYASGDAAAVSELIRTTMRISNSADYEPRRLQKHMDFFSPERIEALSEVRICLVAEENGRIVGTGGLEDDELVTFFVEPGRQGGGIGSALLDAIETIAIGRGVTILRVGATLAGAAFYERHGYQPTGETLEGMAGTHVAMIKRVVPRSDPPADDR